MAQPSMSDYRWALSALARQNKRKRKEVAVTQLAEGLDKNPGLNAGLAASYAGYKAAQDARGFPYRGRGAYSLGKAWRATVGKQGGRMLRQALLNKAVGAIEGSGLYTGHGAYALAGNNLMADIDDTNDVPAAWSIGDETGAIMISHSEYITDVYGAPSAAFLNQTYALNPGIEATFPWLSQIAANFQEYEFIQLVFGYRPQVTDQTTNPQTGMIIYSTNYNPSAAPYSNKSDMITAAHSYSSRIIDIHEHGVECDPEKLTGGSGKFIRTGNLPTGEDLKEYDKGTFQFAMVNTPSTYYNLGVGELWVTYTVMLRKPRMYVNRGLNISKDIFLTPTQTTDPSYVAANTWSVPFNAANAIYKGQQNNIGCSVVGAGTTLTITLPAALTGTFRVTLIMTTIVANGGAAAICVAPTVNTFGNAVALYTYYNGNAEPYNSFVSPQFLDTGATQSGIRMLDFYTTPVIGTTNNTIVFTKNAATTSIQPCYWSLWIEEVNNYGMDQSTDRLVYVDQYNNPVSEVNQSV